jgi:hypothetical protein
VADLVVVARDDVVTLHQSSPVARRTSYPARNRRKPGIAGGREAFQVGARVAAG